MKGDHYICTTEQTIQPLRAARYMHQSAIIKGKNNSWSLLVAGGKSGSRSWLNSVEILDLAPYFKPSQQATDSQGNSTTAHSAWKQCASMQHARSNFAMIAMSDYVYVFGGISGSGDGD